MRRKVSCSGYDTSNAMSTDTVRLFTLGHSTHSQEQLIARLRAQHISILADIRTIPRSRTNPQFNREVFATALHAAGIEYCHEVALGGLRRPRPDSTHAGWHHPGFRGYADHMESIKFQDALTRFVELARTGTRIAFMCAEGAPFRCHRRLLADALIARGEAVAEISGAKTARLWNLTSFARISEGRLEYPG